jgi:hypothetical protein
MVTGGGPPIGSVVSSDPARAEGNPQTDSRELYVRWSVGPRSTAWIGRRAIEEAERLVDSAHSAEWGPLDRR